MLRQTLACVETRLARLICGSIERIGVASAGAGGRRRPNASTIRGETHDCTTPVRSTVDSPVMYRRDSPVQCTLYSTGLAGRRLLAAFAPIGSSVAVRPRVHTRSEASSRPGGRDVLFPSNQFSSIISARRSKSDYLSTQIVTSVHIYDCYESIVHTRN